MGIFTDIGRAKPYTTQIRPAIESRNAIELDRRKTDAYIQGVQSRMRNEAERLQMFQRQQQAQQQQEAELNKLVPWESMALQFEGGPESPMSKFAYELADSSGLLDKSQGGLGAMKIKHQADFQKMLSQPTVASKVSRIRLDYWRSRMNEAQQTLKEKPNDKKAAEALQSAKTGLEQATFQDQALQEHLKNEVNKKKAEASMMSSEASMIRALKEEKESGKDGYDTDKGKMIDDTRAFYNQKSKHLLDPESGLIQLGPEDNPDKYINEYQDILGEMKKDMRRIQKGELPSWYSGEEGEAKTTDEEIAKILEKNGYSPTPENIKKFKKNNDL